MAKIVVPTLSGRVVGETTDDGVAVFKGIPYAAAPIGDLRFRPPQPHAGWDGDRDALAIGTIAPQNGSMEAMLLGTDVPAQSEDCLFLNVWSPSCDSKVRPVMVWIHGGAYVTGSGSNPWYHGEAFATNGDVVIVTMNYRIGAFGFCHLGDVGGERFAGSGNLGLLDQIAALHWVRDNIAQFGGDPNNVTIFGESAGGGSVLGLLSAPAASGLFHKAIAQSASFGQYRTRERADEAGRELLDGLGIAHDNVDAILDLPAADILAAQVAVEAWPTGITGFAPTPDGVVLPRGVLEAMHDGSAAPGVPVLIGSNLDEMRLFTAFDPANAAMDEAEVERRMADIDPARARVLMDAYRAARPGASWGQIASTLGTEHTFHQPAIEVAAARADHGYPTWMYRFTWPSPAFGGIFGSCHAMEIPFVFNTLNHPGAAMLLGTDDDREPLAKVMQQAWVAFAHSGDPGWSAYATSDRATMIFSTTSEIELDPEGDLRKLWTAAT